jgi:hypothetical protein
MDVIALISPEPFIKKCRSLSQAKNPYLDVADGRIRLAWIADTGDGHPDYMERIDLIGLGISYDMLLDALSEAGGTLGAGGRYPIDDVIRIALRSLWKR